MQFSALQINVNVIIFVTPTVDYALRLFRFSAFFDDEQVNSVLYPTFIPECYSRDFKDYDITRRGIKPRFIVSEADTLATHHHAGCKTTFITVSVFFRVHRQGSSLLEVFAGSKLYVSCMLLSVAEQEHSELHKMFKRQRGRALFENRSITQWRD